MPSVTVSVKWQKEVFPAVEIDTEKPPFVFKCQLFDLTGVPPDRQKIMLKGGLLKDDEDWGKLNVKEGQRLMMMGTAEAAPKAPEKVVFVEDLPEGERGVVEQGYTAGLVNLGNTCYMNSTLQCLHSVPELRSALIRYNDGSITDALHTLTVATRDLFRELDRSDRPVTPVRFWTLFRNRFPQFSQQSNGAYMQQDAEECWTQILYFLTQRLQSYSGSDRPAPKALFDVQLLNRVKCRGCSQEAVESETVLALKCHINQEVNHLTDGLKQIFKGELEKTCATEDRSTVHSKESYINGLAPYLTVQFVRFFWKRETNQKAKILRKVDYPMVLDVHDFCSDELKAKLQEPRKALREEEDREAGLKGKEKAEDGKPTEPGTTTSMEVDSAAPEIQLTGIYDLVAVLTHKGRSADSGHYAAWVKQKNGKWIQFDDDKPIPQREEDILKLSGGGDWHTAYICLYKAKVPKGTRG